MFTTFFLLWVTFIVLCIGQLQRWRSTPPTTTIKIGGYLGVVTALAAWYTSAAGYRAGRRLRVRREHEQLVVRKQLGRDQLQRRRVGGR